MSQSFLDHCLALAPHYSLHDLANGDYLLVSEERTVRLKDPNYRRVLPLLTGWRTGEQILQQMVGANASAQDRQGAVDFLAAMLERGYLVLVDPWADTARSALRSASGLEPLGTDRRLSEWKIAVLPFGVDSAAGQGASAELIAMLTAEGFGITDLHHANLAIAVLDDYLQPSLPGLAREWADRKLSWIPFKPGGNRALLGPVIEPWKAGGACFHCLIRRMEEHRPGERVIAAQMRGARPAKGWTRASLALAQARATLEVTQYALGMRQDLARQLLALSVWDGQRQTHPIPSFPDCPYCGPEKGEAKPAPIRIDEDGAIQDAEAGWRVLAPDQALARLEGVVSPITGIVSSMRALKLPDGLHVYVASQGAAASIDPRQNRTLGQPGGASGKGVTDIQAKISCLAEAVERYATQWTGAQPTRLATWRELGQDAPHPGSLLGFSARQYAERETRNALLGRMNRIPEPFRPDARIEWCPAWSLRDDAPRWLPARYCHFDYANPDVAEDHSFCLADSNGCSSGGNLEEAILQGFLELVERDAVAIWWYNRLRLPEIDLAGLDDEFVGTVRRFFQDKGKQVHVLDLTTDLGIPVAVAMAASEGGRRVMLGMGSHLDGRLAVLRALTELVQSSPFDEDRADRRNPLVDQELWDWLDNATFENQPYLLPAEEAARDVHDLPRPRVSSVGAGLRDCVRRMADVGHDFIVHDLSRADLPLNCVRVVVPGLCHFWNRRGAERLYQAPLRMGRLAEALPEAELNPLNFFL